MGKYIFPPSSDMAELGVSGDQIIITCLICGETLWADVNFLNEVIKAWTDHVESKRKEERASSTQ